MTLALTPNLGLPYPVAGTQEPADIFVAYAAAAILLDAHDHSAGSGTAIGRLQTGSLPAAGGEVQIDTASGLFKFHDGSAVKSVVDSLTAQSIANKTLTGATLTAPTIGDFSNAQHDHLDADDGGTLSGSSIASGITGSGLVVKQTSPTIDAPNVTGGMGVTGALSVSGAITGSSSLGLATFADLTAIASPANPAGGVVRLFAKSDGLVYRRTSAGVEAPVGGANCRTLASESLSPVSGCDPVFRSSGTSRYELAFLHTEDGHASVNFTIPQNYAGGTIRFKPYVWTTATAQTVWRLYAVALGDAAGPDTAWVSLGDNTVVHVANQLKSFTVDWTVGAADAGKLVRFALQRVAVSHGSDTYNDVAYFSGLDIQFGA